ncbi:sensor histidine kinase [Paenibacillus nasutitermitis]|nr:sensor histidine kinase [Paenibacillus nasutitermitis]
MKKIPGILKFNILSKLVVSFLLVVIPIYGISLYMNQSAEESLRSELSQSVVSRLHFYVSSIETEMQRLMKLNQALIFDDEFQKIRTIAHAMDDFTRAQTILSVKNKLDLLKTSSPYVEEVKVFIPSLGRGIFANSFDNHIPADELEILEQSPSKYGTPFTYWKGRLLLSEVYPEPIHKASLTIALGVELSGEQLQHSLEQLSNMKGAGASFVNLQQDWVVSDGKNDMVLPELRAFLEKPGFQDSKTGQGIVDVQGSRYLLTFEYSQLLDTYLTVYVPESELLGPLSKHRMLLWMLSIISLAVILLFSLWIYRLIHRPLRRLVISFRKVERGDMNVEIHHQNKDEFNYLYAQFNAMVHKLHLLIQEVYEERIRSQQSELKQLQSQINPHFLYNSLYILKGLVQMDDNRSAETLIEHLGEYFMFITRTGTEEISLEQEFAHSKAYTEIQDMRFFNRIEVEWAEIPEQYRSTQVPRLILQPIIENAYEHGLEEKLSGGKLSVSVLPDSDALRIIVEDNGDKLDEERLLLTREQLRTGKKNKESTGLFNVHRRLQIKYGESYGVSVARGASGGMRVELKLACKEEERHVQIADRG